MNLIAAVSREWGIGKDGQLLFSIPNDMKFFRDKTRNKTVVMGRKTLESLPGGNPLKMRKNIVLTRDENYKKKDCEIMHSIEDFISKYKDDSDIFVIGGAEIYNSLLPYCKRAYITKVNASADADTFIKNLDNMPEWHIAESSEEFTHDGLAYRFCIYEK